MSIKQNPPAGKISPGDRAAAGERIDEEGRGRGGKKRRQIDQSSLKSSRKQGKKNTGGPRNHVELISHIAVGGGEDDGTKD